MSTTVNGSLLKILCQPDALGPKIAPLGRTDTFKPQFPTLHLTQDNQIVISHHCQNEQETEKLYQTFADRVMNEYSTLEGTPQQLNNVKNNLTLIQNNIKDRMREDGKEPAVLQSVERAFENMKKMIQIQETKLNQKKNTSLQS